MRRNAILVGSLGTLFMSAPRSFATESATAPLEDLLVSLIQTLEDAGVIGPTSSRRCHGSRQCGPHGYCAKPIGDCDGEGRCRRRPQVCPENYDPVCGCDRQTYANACFAAMAGVSIAHLGECRDVCGGITGIPCPDDEFCLLPDGECCCDIQGECTPIPPACPDVWDPVCGCDGMTHAAAA